MSIVEDKILDEGFVYEQPWFYNNRFSLRCELGVGKGVKYMRNAVKRAFTIYDMLFQDGADCLFFNDYIYDYNSDSKVVGEDVKNILKAENNRLKFTLNYLKRYKNHKIIGNLKTNLDEDDLIRVDRVVCYLNGDKRSYNIIKSQIKRQNNPIVSFVSFKNECIFSVYDDRGCDIVFFDKNKFIEYYEKLKPFFLDYDKEEMSKKYLSAINEI